MTMKFTTQEEDANIAEAMKQNNKIELEKWPKGSPMLWSSKFAQGVIKLKDGSFYWVFFHIAANGDIYSVSTIPIEDAKRMARNLLDDTYIKMLTETH